MSQVLMPFAKLVAATVSTGLPFRTASGLAAATYDRLRIADNCDAVDLNVTKLMAETVSSTVPQLPRSSRFACVIELLIRTLMPIAASPTAGEAENSAV